MPAFKWGWTAPKTFTHRHMGAFVDSDLEHYEILSDDERVPRLRKEGRDSARNLAR